MKFFKKSVLVGVLSVSLTLPMSGCSSTTEAGAVGADRKQLLLVSSEEVLALSNQAYQQTISQARQAGKLDVDTVPLQLRSVIKF